ncbi:hypothetical protein [Puniceibacterium sediminis]|uniref:hypothetical protein n=1 Tax=Puniceibacterium sediminis TaxID=1608407 RepID=UPI001131C150|nr:hypothetical protein [Puniceibacterium sediminis]
MLVNADGPGALEPMLATRAARIVLINANPTQQDALQRAATRDARLSLTPIAVAATDGSAPFHAQSLTGLSGLCPPQDLRDLFPGLRETARSDVPTLPLEQVLRQIDLPEHGCHVLCLDLPADSVPIARQIADLPSDLAPEHVFLRTALPGLYEGGTAVEPVLEALEAQGYSLDGSLTEDPDFPEYWLRRDPLRLRCAQLESEAQELRRALETAHADAKEVGMVLAESQSRLASKDSRIEELVNERTASDARSRAHEGRIRSLETQIAEASTAAEAEKEVLRQKVTGLEKILETAQEEARSKAEEIEKAQDTLRKESAAIHTRAQQDTALAIRLQTLAREDLQDLRRRYQELLADKTAQDELLRSVTARLQQAAEYLQQLDPAVPLPGAGSDQTTLLQPSEGASPPDYGPMPPLHKVATKFKRTSKARGRKKARK